MKTNAIAGRTMALMLLLPLAACGQSGNGNANGDVAQAVKEVQQQT